MTTEKQIVANKANALKGGVKTKEGKNVSKMNALKFGFFSQTVNEYDKLNSKEFCDAIYNYYTPENVYECQLIEILLSNILTYRRICFIEQEFIKSILNPTVKEDLFEGIGLKETIIQQGYVPQINVQHAEQIEKIQKYKTTALNSIIKAQHELERLIAKRKGYNTSAPMSLDVNISNNQ